MKRSLSQRVLALALGCAVAGSLVVALELAARRVEPERSPVVSVPRQVEPGLALAPHPYLLWEHEPGERQEVGVTVRINSMGLRGPEPLIPKPAGLRRLVATGDSTVYGFGVPEDAMFIRQAVGLLGGREAGLEGWSAALPGYSTLQTLNLLRMRALALEPDLLVVANLWSDHSTEAFEDAELLDLYGRYDGSLAGAVDRSLRRLALYRLLHWELAVRRGAQARARRGWAPSPDPSREHQQRVPLPEYAANLDALVALAREHDADVLFLVLPHPNDSEPPAGGPEPAYEGYRRAMRAAAQRHGLPLVAGDRAIADSDLPAAELWLDNIHPSAAGHALLAEALAQSLAGWVRGEELR